ncbi:hypothetical protein LSAT2_020661, partial [Lamellibrachia satsuma]
EGGRKPKRNNTNDCMGKRGRKEAEEAQHKGLSGEEKEGGSRRGTTQRTVWGREGGRKPKRNNTKDCMVKR